MALDPIHAFYCSKSYLELAQICKLKSGGVCSRCKKIFDINELRPHHIIELTLENINDVNITLNEKNIEVLCHDCHNAIHNRFGNAIGEKHVYLVCGSPFSGKTSYVETVATRNDLIVDLDKIHQSICICTKYDKPNATKQLAFAIRSLLLNEIQTATQWRKWQNAYIIAMCPERYEREEFVNNYGAEIIQIKTPIEECIKRVNDTINNQAMRDVIIGWITNYWQRYKE